MDKRAQSTDAGFSLIELMVIVVIIAVLLMVAIPTFLAARERTADNAAKARAQHGVKVQLTHATDAAETFATASEATEIDRSVPFETYTSGTVPTQVMGAVYVKDPAGGVVTLVSRSTSGTCFWSRVKAGVPTYASNDCTTEPDPGEFDSSW